jgi:hypothetical protein
MRLLIPFF